MALIGRIRKHSWVIVASLATALLGFLIMDVVTGNKYGGNTKYSIGKIDGENIDYNDFARTEQILYNNSGSDAYARRNYLWNFFVEKTLLDNVASKTGLGISETELEELQFGNNLSPVISQRFMNQNTRTVDRDQLNQIKQGLENNTLRADLVTYWNEQKKEILKDRLQSKYTGLVTKAVYVPTWLAEIRNQEANELIDFQYVKLPFDINKDSIAVTDHDIQSYISSHQANYNYPEEARFIDYVNFKVIPTAEDSATIFKELSKLVDSFKTTKNDTTFLIQNEGSLDQAYFTQSQLSPVHGNQIYALPKGGVLGPYIDGNNYRVAKMMDKKIIPDSVKARHIVRSVQNQNQLASAEQTIDSLKTLLEKGTAKFDSLAIRFSQDPGSGFQGGELGMIAHDVMVKPFNDVIFFQAVPGKYYKVTSQFGVHLIEVTKQVFKKGGTESVQVAYLTKPIIPSQETQNKMEDEVTGINNANRTLADLKKALATRNDITFEHTGPVKQNDAAAGQLPSNESTRSLVRWAFDKKTKAGDVSPEIYTYEDAVNFVTNQITIAGLNSIQPKGLASVAISKDDISMILINKIKADKIIKEIGSIADIYTLATKYNVKVDTASNVNFSTSFLPQMGNEPKVVAAAFGTEKNATSKPIIGNGGVYVVKTVGHTPSVGSADMALFKEQAGSVSKNNFQSFFMESLKKTAKISDNRFKFF